MPVLRHLAAALILLAAAACTTVPQVRQARDLPPLGPCPASDWRPETTPPTASARISMVLLAVQEWARFARQTVAYPAAGPPRLEQPGIREREVPERINVYWRAVDKPDRTGLDDVPWSAAFISWVVASAGVPRDLFCPDQRHTIYVERAVLRSRQPGAALLAHSPADYAPRVGDLVCASRDDSGTTLDNLNRGAGHCDIVVELRPREIHTIGGNVQDSVTRSIFPADESGRLLLGRSRPFFAVLENRLD